MLAYHTTYFTLDTLMETIKQQSSIRGNMLFITNKLNFGENDVVADIPEQIITSYTKGDSKAFASVADKIKVSTMWSCGRNETVAQCLGIATNLVLVLVVQTGM